MVRSADVGSATADHDRSDPTPSHRPGVMMRLTKLSRLAAGVFGTLGLLGLTFPLGAAGAAHGDPTSAGPKPTIVLVHGGWADASSWNAIAQRLQKDGYTVIAPANPLRGV